MHEDIRLLKEIHGCFEAEQAAAWARAVVPVILRSAPHLASCSAMAGDGFAEALMALHATLDKFDEDDPESTAFEICDRLADVLDLIP